jgi:uncharacterized membrane protein YqaE (UPF0057 family)
LTIFENTNQIEKNMERSVKTLFLVGVLLYFGMANSSAVEKKAVPSAIGTSGTTISIDETGPVVVAVETLTFKQKFRAIKTLKREWREAKKASPVPVVVLYILAVLLPPVAVGIFTNWGQPTLWNLLFTLLMWVPGVVHAFYILLK